MKIYVVIKTYFNGEDDSNRVYGVYTSKEKAEEIKVFLNCSRTSAYSSTYEVEEYEADTEFPYVNF